MLQLKMKPKRKTALKKRIKKQSLLDEFNQLRYDDWAFAEQYRAKEFKEWIKDHNIKI